VNPEFKIVANNALDLLTSDPDDASSSTNAAYLDAIDGLSSRRPSTYPIIPQRHGKQPILHILRMP
jgi:hypothetical protein